MSKWLLKNTTGRQRGTQRELILKEYIKYTGAVQKRKPITNIGQIRATKIKQSLRTLKLLYVWTKRSEKKVRYRYLMKWVSTLNLSLNRIITLIVSFIISWKNI